MVDDDGRLRVLDFGLAKPARPPAGADAASDSRSATIPLRAEITGEGKILGTALFYLPTGHGWREGLVVGGAMNGRGAVEIIVAGIGLELGLVYHKLGTKITVLEFMDRVLPGMEEELSKEMGRSLRKKKIDVNLKKILKGKREDLLLEDKDVVVVPETIF